MARPGVQRPGEPLDGGPPVIARAGLVAGQPLNPVMREPPADPVLTGVSAIDGLTTSCGAEAARLLGGGLPHLELATQIARRPPRRRALLRRCGGDGTDPRRRRHARRAGGAFGEAGELVLLLNTADDPVVERILTPRLALTIAQHLPRLPRPPRAGGRGRHDQLLRGPPRGVGRAGRGAARHAYPGYLYSDLASLYERCGRVRGRPGSVTVRRF